MGINEDVVLGLQEYPQDLPPGIERRAGHRSSAERSNRASSREHRASSREQGSLRIRLSDNELRAAQLIQERFQLRSTVAALGFCLRTMAQMVEQGQLSEDILVAQLPQHTDPSRHDSGQQPKHQEPAVRPDPLARPAKQQSKPLNNDPLPSPAAQVDALVTDDSTADFPQPEEG